MNRDEKMFFAFCKVMFLLILVVTSLFGLVIGAEVMEELEDIPSGETVRVIISLKNESSLSNHFFGTNSKHQDNIKNVGLPKENIKHDLGTSVSAFITKEDLRRLKKNEHISSIKIEPVFHTLLQNATTIMNSTGANKLLSNSTFGFNLTGIGQTVCIIDTGVNYSHPDLGGCFGENDPTSGCKIIGGYDYCADDGACSTEDSDPIAVNEHGTHVSGIVAANGGITGIAPQAKIVMLKAGNSTGDFSVSDIVASINWCVNNASIFNISVISMSLGSGDTYPGSCDGVFPTITTAINNAASKNISVVVSAGNAGNSSGISNPACIVNATPVGSTDKVDAISSFSNRNSLVKLFATGSSINSTDIDGISYNILDGTSMSAPMVSGAIAILRQYLNLTSQTKTPFEIEDILYDTGLQFSESSNNFSRINVYNATLSIDSTSPNITLVSPSNNLVDLNVNVTFTCNATDWQLSNLTLNLWNTTSLYYSSSENVTGTANSSSFNVTNIAEDTYTWNCLGVDVEGNSGYASSNYSLVVGGISVSLTSPTNETHTNTNDTNFSCRSISELSYELSNATFSLWNATGNLTYNLTSDVSGFDNTTTFNYTFSEEGNYSWNCLAVNNNSNSTSALGNFSIVYDVTSPNISSLLEKDVTTTTATINWTTNELSNSSILGDLLNSFSSLVTAHSLSFSGLTASTTYSYTAESCDQAGNCANSSSSFTTNAEIIVSGGGNSPSRVSVTSAAISEERVVTEKELEKGPVSLSLKSKEKVTFEVVEMNHTLTVNFVGVNSVSITVTSDPVNLTLYVGDEVKLNLSSLEYYSTRITLHGITLDVANISIEKIRERIFPVIEDKPFHTTGEPTPRGDNKYIIIIGIGIITVFLILILFNKFKWDELVKEYLKNKQQKKLKGQKSLYR
ncbi:MAG: S8 family serine peptidase [Nanoarchaeota archaeon]|nr:S8 family serine peptidase [Nanoarchaeota archaeon]